MPASDQVDQVISIRLKEADPKVVAAMRQHVDESEELVYGNDGPIAHWIGVFFTIPNTKVHSNFRPYLVTDCGIRVGYVEKAGMFKTVPRIYLVPKESIHGINRTFRSDPFDGSQTRTLELHDQNGTALLTVKTMYVGGTGHDFAGPQIRAISQGLAIPPDDSFDF